MKSGTILDPQRLLKPLCIVVLAFIAVNMLFTPLFDFVTVEERQASRTVTVIAYFAVQAFIFFGAVAAVFLRSRPEKLFLRFMVAFFLYAFLFTAYVATDLFYPMFGLISLLGATLVGVLFYVAAREDIISPKAVFYLLAFAFVFVALPMLLVQIDTERFARLSEEFGANIILYGYENPRALGWAATISLSLLAGYVSTQSSDGKIPLIFLFMSIIAATTLFWSGSRGGVVAFVVSISVVFSFSKTKNYRGLSAILLCVAVGAVTSLLLYLPGSSYGLFARIEQTLGAESVGEMGSGRIVIWTSAISYILERPFTGVGYLPHKSLEGLSAGSAHNIILEFWLGFGLIIGTIMLLAGALLWTKAFSFFRTANDPAVSALFCVVTTFIVYSMVSGPYARTFPLLLLAVSFGVVLGRRASKARTENGYPEPRATSSDGSGTG